MKTAMQDLREDLVSTLPSSEQTLLEIENQQIREACQKVVRITLEAIIKRIDDELLEMEKQQIKDAFDGGWKRANETKDKSYTTSEDFGNNYYNKTFN